MCVAQDGVIKRNLARRFKIKTVEGQDDIKSTEEVVSRRLKHSVENPKGAFGELPDIIFADGGIAQVRAIKRALAVYDLGAIEVFGMLKDDKHRTKTLINDKREDLLLEGNKEILNFVTNLQDEVHNTAIEYNRKLAEKNMTRSKLDDIEGIGEIKRNALLKEFGSIEGIKNAEISDITKIKGITETLAKKIKQNL